MENEQAEQVAQAPSRVMSDEQLVAMLIYRARNEGLSGVPAVLRHGPRPGATQG
ncbi:hypothetical protein [Streptomyces sp. NPDC020917]|uniref:hypothetical protein n=1 Tax=Streptomyces sp. NPDC020917 TaxID=3365102 RepID=UPI00378B5087